MSTNAAPLGAAFFLLPLRRRPIRRHGRGVRTGRTPLHARLHKTPSERGKTCPEMGAPGVTARRHLHPRNAAILEKPRSQRPTRTTDGWARTTDLLIHSQAL